MTRKGLIQYATRAVSLTLFVTGLVYIGNSLFGLLPLMVALAIIGWLPTLAYPSDAYRPHRLSAILGPDILGHLLTGFFIALPFWTGAEAEGGIHIMALMTWPMAIGGIFLVVIAAGNASRWFRIGDHVLEVVTAWRHDQILYADIVRIEPWRRGLPPVLHSLVPFLVAGGRFTAAGALVLARDSTGTKLVLADGRSMVIENEVFGIKPRRLVQLLKRQGVAKPMQGKNDV